MTEEKNIPTEDNNATSSTLADEVLRTVLTYNKEGEKLKLSEVLGALCFAGLEVYFASRFAVQNPEQHAGDGKSEKESVQPSA